MPRSRMYGILSVSPYTNKESFILPLLPFNKLKIGNYIQLKPHYHATACNSPLRRETSQYLSSKQSLI
jgi:hypothetical protein